MKGIFLILGCVLCFSCSTKYNYIDTGTAVGYYDGTMLEYFRHDTWHNWDSIAKVIDRCSPELKSLFESTDANIPFFGPKNISFEKFFFWAEHEGSDVTNYNKNYYRSIDEFPRDFCDQIVKTHLYTGGKVMRDDVPRLERDEEGVADGGGMVLSMMYGNKIWIWSLRNAFAGVEETADVELRAAAVEEDGKTITNNLGTIATTNLENQSGVVHALGDQYFLGQLFELE